MRKNKKHLQDLVRHSTVYLGQQPNPVSGHTMPLYNCLICKTTLYKYHREHHYIKEHGQQFKEYRMKSLLKTKTT